MYQSFFRLSKPDAGKNMTTWEEKSSTLLNTLVYFGERANLSNYMLSECMHFSWYLFYCIYVVFAVWRYVCAFYASFLLILFIKKHITTDDESWQLYRGSKKSRRIMNLWRGKKYIEKSLWGIVGSNDINMSNKQITRRQKTVTKLKRTPEMRSENLSKKPRLMLMMASLAKRFSLDSISTFNFIQRRYE